jgi:hypothetical protein
MCHWNRSQDHPIHHAHKLKSHFTTTNQSQIVCCNPIRTDEGEPLPAHPRPPYPWLTKPSRYHYPSDPLSNLFTTLRKHCTHNQKDPISPYYPHSARIHRPLPSRSPSRCSSPTDHHLCRHPHVQDIRHSVIIFRTQPHAIPVPFVYPVAYLER